MGRKIEYEFGERFGNSRLVYLYDTPRQNPKVRRAMFRCDCGNEIDRPIAWVRHGNTSSCGCYKSEYVTEKNTKHSHALRNNQSGAYRSWKAMHQRVLVDPNYQNISICERWSGEDGFVNFLEDMGDRPSGFTIERINNNLGYAPDNCKWATYLEQAQNTRNVVHLTMDGETHSINEWCRRLNVPYYLIKQRRQRGMTLEEAFKTPIDQSKRGRLNRGKKNICISK